MYVHVWRSKDNFQESIFSSTIWILGIELKSTGLEASAFISWAA